MFNFFVMFKYFSRPKARAEGEEEEEEEKREGEPRLAVYVEEK